MENKYNIKLENNQMFLLLKRDYPQGSYPTDELWEAAGVFKSPEAAEARGERLAELFEHRTANWNEARQFDWWVVPVRFYNT